MSLDRLLYEHWQRTAASMGLAVLILGGLVAAGESWADRSARIAGMTPAEKDQLLRQQQRFLRLAPDEQQRLRTLAAELEQAPDASELRQVLNQYYEWLLTLPGIERAQLLQLDSQQRLKRIKQLKGDQVRLAAHRLSPSDAQVIFNWLERRVIDNSQPAMRERLQNLPPAERHREVVRLVWQRTQSPEGFKGPGQLKPGEMQALRGELSESARRQLNEALDDRNIGQLMTDWVKQALGAYFNAGRPLAGAPAVSEERLRQFFEQELPEQQRQQLLTLPADELLNQLRRLYFLRMQGGGPAGLPGGRGTPRRPIRSANPPDATSRDGR